MKIILTLIATTILTAQCGISFGQCDNCPEPEGFKKDYCFTTQEINGLCAQFGLEESHIFLTSGKKKKLVPLEENDSLGYYVSLATDKKLKLSALEILFIKEAIPVWKKEKRDIGMEYTESGLGYKINKQGEGESPQTGQKVTVHYTGTLEDGTKFDSSVDRNQPFAFTLGVGQVIKGWDEGIALLNKGSKAVLKIPSDLGYGPRGAGGVIPPNATLYFEVELIDFE